MLEILRDMARSERGRRLLINLLRSMDAEHTQRDSAITVLQTVEMSAPPHKNCWILHESSLKATIFKAPDEFQFKGPKAIYSPARWMTIKSMADLRFFMETPDGTLPPDLDDIVRIIDSSGPQDGFLDEYYLRFAEILSDEDAGINFLLAKAHPDPKNPSRLRPVPSWYSRWCHYPYQKRFSAPSEHNAGRLRDWLGLGYGLEDPLFVIRARKEMDVASLGAHRPTPWEGFDNPLYKHLANAQFERDGNGSTADIELLRALAGAGGDVEGGPEIVSKGVIFDPRLFECVFLGMAPAIGYDLHEGPFHRVLLNVGETIERVIERLKELLHPQEAR